MNLTQLDLQYISNPSYYRDKEEVSSNLYDKKDIRFYKKRILYTFKEMVKQPEKIDHLPLSLQNTFHDIIREYIEYFKQLDTTDALQSFIPENKLSEKERINNEDIIDEKKANTFLFSNEVKQNKIKHKTMKDFCIDVSKKNKKKTPNYPKQKQFSIHSKKHKIKGIPSRAKKI